MNPTVLITGTDSGLGYAFVKKFLSENWCVFAGFLLPDSPVKQLSSSACTPVFLDVTDMPSIQAARSRVESNSDTRGLDMIINNAGIHTGVWDSLEHVDFETVSRVIDVNAVGPLRVTQQFYPLLKQGEFKRIVNVSSEAGSISDCTRDSWFGYNMSKAALNMQTKILHNYLSQSGFSVFSVHPGGMRTNMGSPDMGFAPEDSAALLYDLITRPNAGSLPRFFQFDGKALPW